ncbi:glycoside hydrolase family 18 [Phocaeicola sp.]|uniref:glycoside hydrolase family 18 n=1 Tax=Phocaeicola sp. TaxID=2773926 RepID=UPI003869CC5F
MMTFKSKIKTLCSAFVLAGALFSCTDVENLEIQKPYTYSDQYYADLRAYKASDHQISFMWFSDYTASHSLGIRFMGLPDSLDICSLWGGIPKPDTNPLVYEEMRFCQKVKGMKMTMVTFPSIGGNPWLEEYPEEEWIQVYGDSLLSTVYLNDLDGMDLDYEIHGDWMHGDNFVKLIKYLGQYIGPKGKDPSKLLIVDFYADYPSGEIEPYINYFVRQAYTQGFSEHNASRLQNYYDYISCPPEKFIVTENIGDHWQNGGSPFTEADGNQYKENGERLYSLEGMARWNPYQGKKGGFGAFYGQRDYNSTPPYKHFRNAIQAQNPAVR